MGKVMSSFLGRVKLEVPKGIKVEVLNSHLHG